MKAKDPARNCPPGIPKTDEVTVRWRRPGRRLPAGVQRVSAQYASTHFTPAPGLNYLHKLDSARSTTWSA
jgi:hypothetical protein